MDIRIVETQDLDYTQVVDIFYSIGFLKKLEKRKIYQTAIEKAFRNSQFVVAAFDGNQLIGFGRVVTDTALFATIWNMIVRPDYQKQGIGKMIIQKCLEHYPDLQFFLIADQNVVGFYEKNGFKLHPYAMYLEKGRKVCIIYT